MRITNLMEDTSGESGFLFEHGLCFYIETERHKLLMDTGASGAFLVNAEKKGIDLGAVDTVIISHGHYDHTGGLLAFANVNSHAKIYIHKNAVGDYYNLRNPMPKYIGMDPKIASLEQVIFVDGDLRIDSELSLFTNVQGKRLLPRGNRILKKKCGNAFVQDSFDHEQYLVIAEGAKRVLLSGCAHKGILNILDAYRLRFSGEPTHVISGFHTTNSAYTQKDKDLILQTARELSGMHTVFYSGHCTGEYPMQLLKEILQDRLIVLHSGDEIPVFDAV